MPILSDQDHRFFEQKGYIVKTDLLSSETISDFQGIYDRDLSGQHYRWHPYGYHQSANYDVLITSPNFDSIVREPNVLGAVEELMGGTTCFGEIGARHMKPYQGDLHRSWHRDRPHWLEHRTRMDYIQSMVYLTDVGPDTHCFSISPEPADAPQREKQEQLAAGDIVDLYGPAGTAVLFNIAVLHSASVRVTQRERKTVQVYYGHRQRPALSNDSTIPATLWRDHDDAETRAFYGNLNEKTRRYLAAF